MKRWLSMLLAVLSVLPLWACAEELPEVTPTPPASLRSASSVEGAEAFLLYPSEEGLNDVEAGYIRYIAQHRANDPTFRSEYWLGGEVDSDLDLNRKENRYGYPYTFHAGNMCTRAAYSMALSYLGVDITPGGMTALTGRRDLDPPYAQVSELVGVELVQPKAYVFDTMLENYLTDPAYSPVYLYLRKPDGKDHSLLVIAALPEKSCYLVLDPSGLWVHGEPYRVYMIALNKLRNKVINSTFRSEYVGSQVLTVYQWRLSESNNE